MPTDPQRCFEKAPFSVVTIRPSGEATNVWSCSDHLANMVNREACAIKDADGGRPVIVKTVKPLRRCEYRFGREA